MRCWLGSKVANDRDKTLGPVKTVGFGETCTCFACTIIAFSFVDVSQGLRQVHMYVELGLRVQGLAHNDACR